MDFIATIRIQKRKISGLTLVSPDETNLGNTRLKRIKPHIKTGRYQMSTTSTDPKKVIDQLSIDISSQKKLECIWQARNFQDLILPGYETKRDTTFSHMYSLWARKIGTPTQKMA
ncbi:hypothetical protein [Pseudomonas synxantha]|uniref:Uncharacterized protein n=1 Tax=Pseudomonas synxantha TaxID=47883 RepID=A0ACC6JR90_9PSED|nr:hypothetical protein [Pseudomonas synxantha]MDR6608806.1 hypothetical protein [Pseudomonas synxantha]